MGSQITKTCIKFDRVSRLPIRKFDDGVRLEGEIRNEFRKTSLAMLPNHKNVINISPPQPWFEFKTLYPLFKISHNDNRIRWCKLSANGSTDFLRASSPSSWGILGYRTTTSIVHKIECWGKSERSLSFFRKSLVSLIYDFRILAKGCK